MTVATTYFQPYKGRRLNPGQRVQVYRNLNIATDEVWFSIRDAETGLVLGHSQAILLSNAKFKVSEAGRQRVLRTKTKNVHSVVEGNWSGPYYSGWRELYTNEDEGAVRISYNPYNAATFIRKDNDAPVHNASLVIIDHQTGVFAHSIKETQ